MAAFRLGLRRELPHEAQALAGHADDVHAGQAGAWIPPGETGWLPALDDRSPDPEICPFLRAADDQMRIALGEDLAPTLRTLLNKS